MPIPVKMPKLDRLSTEGRVMEWLKTDQEKVEKGEKICRVETAKTTFEIEAPEAGILHRKIETGATVPVAEILAFILLPAEGNRTVGAPPDVVSTPAYAERPTDGKTVFAAPSVRKAAKERGVDLSKIKGTGPQGRILLKDVTSHARKDEAVEPVRGDLAVLEEIPVVGWRKIMSERMSLSSRELAQLTTMAEVDVTEMESLRKQLQSDLEKKGLTYTAFIVKAVAQAIQKYPILNSSMRGDKIVVYKNRNIGVAIAREELGLIVPVIHNADKISIWEIADKIHAFTDKAERNTFSPEDLLNGTFTITNPGMMGVLMNTPLINYPESAILGVGAIVSRPAVRDNQIAIRSMMILSLSYDHRVVDGAPAIRFLQEVKRLLEEPALLLL